MLNLFQHSGSLLKILAGGDGSTGDCICHPTGPVPVHSDAVRSLQCTCHVRETDRITSKRSQLECVFNLFGRHHCVWSWFLPCAGLSEDSMDVDHGEKSQAETN